MSSSFSSESNMKLVIQWKKEYREITVLAGKIIQSYKTNELNMLRKELENLTDLTIVIMAENMEFYQFLMLEDALDAELKELIENFKETRDTLMNFSTKYTLADAVYDEEFIDNFMTIIDVLSQRISYEEKTLYKALQEK